MVSLAEIRAVLTQLQETAPSPARAAAVRAAWEALLALVEAKLQSRDPDNEGIDYSDLPPLGDDDAYWTGGRIGPVLPAGRAERPTG